MMESQLSRVHSEAFALPSEEDVGGLGIAGGE